MKVLRIVLKQNSANYKKEETVTNKMTYPLPPVSTVIGAVHGTCGYREYHPMNLSIQGKFESLVKRAYTDYCFLNSINDDRGILVKLRNESLLSNAFDKVASINESPKKNAKSDEIGKDVEKADKESNGDKKDKASFKEGNKIKIHNKSLLLEYQGLKNLKEGIDEYKKTEYKEKIAFFKNEKKKISEIKKALDKKTDAYKNAQVKERQVRQEQKDYEYEVKKYEKENYTDIISKYKSLVTSLKFYEVLCNVELIIHIDSDEDTLNDIKENIYSLKSIGRSEDFVDVISCDFVELKESDDCDIVSEYSAYLSYDDVCKENIFTKSKSGSHINGTKYCLNKNYKIVDNKRVFDKKKVVYASHYAIEETSENIYIDDSSDKNYIVNFI